MLFASKEKQPQVGKKLWRVFKLVAPSMLSLDWYNLPDSGNSKKSGELRDWNLAFTLTNFVLPTLGFIDFLATHNIASLVNTVLLYAVTKTGSYLTQSKAIKLAKESPASII